MKNIFITLFLSGILSANLHAQVNYLPADSLLKWFENSHHPFDVWDSIRNWEKNRTYITDFNYKEYYQTPSLKPHLMKWLDRKLIKEYKIEQYLNENRFNMDPDKSYDSIDHWLDSVRLSNEIKKLLKQQEDSITIDSVLANTELFKSYKDAVIDKNTQESKATYQKGLNPFPDSRIVGFHMNLAYPESYQQIRFFWEETGKGTERNDYFIPLVRMGDPEARKIFDIQIKEVVRTNGRDVFLNSLLSTLGGELRGSYGTSKFIELLEVEQEIEIFADGDVRGDFNCEVLDYLISDIFTYNIEVDPVVKYRAPCEKHLEYLPEIKQAAQRLIEHYKEQEYYWMSNMPFYEE